MDNEIKKFFSFEFLEEDAQCGQYYLFQNEFIKEDYEDTYRYWRIIGITGLGYNCILDKKLSYR